MTMAAPEITVRIGAWPSVVAVTAATVPAAELVTRAVTR